MPLAAALAGIVALALGLAGCGGATSKQSTPAALKLQREDLVAASRALGRAETSVAAEVAATRTVWPRIAGGATAPLSTAAPAPGTGRRTASARADRPGLADRGPVQKQRAAEHARLDDADRRRRAG